MIKLDKLFFNQPKMDYFLMALKKYATFSGRSTRSEYWHFALFTFIIVIIVLETFLFLGLYSKISVYETVYISSTLFFLLPSLAVTIRRLHDIGKSGWMCLINLIPIAGPIWFIILMCKDSQPGKNQYGENPKGINP